MTVVTCKERFDLPDQEEVRIIYLDGNSLGPLPRAAVARAHTAMKNEWGNLLIRAWNTAGWMELPKTVGDRIAKLIGAPPGSVATGDTLSIKVYQSLAAGLQMRPNRHVILSDTGNFPTDLYMAQGLIGTIMGGNNNDNNKYELRTVSPETIIDAMDETVAVVMLTHVDYRSGRMHDMNAITAAAHRVGAIMLWDLAHSVGAVPVDVMTSQAEFAVGCTYKYLNGGPGSPAFIYVRPDLVTNIQPALAGWLGHEAPFAMDLDYRPAMSTERLRVGTPPIVQLSILDAALDIWDDVDMIELRQASIELSETFRAEMERRCPMLQLISPRDPALRGSHVSFSLEYHGYAAMQALIAKGVIGDFRSPDILRFGITPLYLDRDDILAAVEIIETVMKEELWRDPKYQIRARVT